MAGPKATNQSAQRKQESMLVLVANIEKRLSAQRKRSLNELKLEWSCFEAENGFIG
jgi:hypothetical protein